MKDSRKDSRFPKKVMKLFQAWGKRGGEVRRDNLTPARRKEIATLAVRAREKKRAEAK